VHVSEVHHRPGVILKLEKSVGFLYLVISTPRNTLGAEVVKVTLLAPECAVEVIDHTVGGTAHRESSVGVRRPRERTEPHQVSRKKKMEVTHHLSKTANSVAKKFNTGAVVLLNMLIGL
jgi:hypothetical protein